MVMRFSGGGIGHRSTQTKAAPAQDDLENDAEVDGNDVDEGCYRTLTAVYGRDTSLNFSSSYPLKRNNSLFCLHLPPVTCLGFRP